MALIMDRYCRKALDSDTPGCANHPCANRTTRIEVALDYLQAMNMLVRSVELGSFSKAAASFGLKASSVSRYVANLEEDLGTVLFRRSTRQLLLTDAGAAFYERAAIILADVEEARRSTSEAAAEPVGTLKLWAPVEFGKLHLSSLLPRFLAASPGLSIDLTLGDSDQDTALPQFDLSIQIGEPADSRFYAHKFARNRYVVCCAPSYFDRAPEPQYPSGLRDHNCLLHSNRDVWRFGSAKSSVEVAVAVVGNFRSNRLEPVLEAALGGAGLARLPLWLAGRDLAARRLIPILTNYEIVSPDHTIYGLHPEKRSMSPKVRTFLEFLTHEVGTPPFWENQFSDV